jgi:chromosome segregation ATPase
MKKLLPILILLFFLSGCLPAWRSTPSNRSINQNWQVVDIQAEIDRREDSSPSDNKNRFILAILHTHPRNQRPDYQAAKKHLNEYIMNLPTKHEDWQAQYIYHLLERINAADEEIDRTGKQLEMKSAEQLACQTQQEACRKKLKTVQDALKKSKKKSKQALSELEKTKNTSTKTQLETEHLQIENQKLKKQLEDLTKLYINLEKKRQAIQ